MHLDVQQAIRVEQEGKCLMRGKMSDKGPNWAETSQKKKKRGEPSQIAKNNIIASIFVSQYPV